MNGFPRHWHPADLERRLTAVLDVALRALEVLAPEGYTDAADPAADVPPDKVVAETAMLLLAAARSSAGRPALRERVDELARQLGPFARCEQVRARVCLEPSLALTHACAHVCLACAGYADPAYDRLLRAGLAWPDQEPSRERPPHRELEQQWLQGLMGSPTAPQVPAQRSVVASSMLGRQLDTLSGTRNDAYALTHAVMFATDLGNQRLRLPRTRTAVQADVEFALAISLDQHDYDLAGELLLCWPMLRMPWSPAAAFAFHVLAAVEDEAGFLPTPLVRTERYRALEGTAQRRYALATAYHTVYVMGLLCASALTNRCAPPRTVSPARRHLHEVSDHLLAHLKAAGPRQWLDHALPLSPGRQAALSPLFLAIALHRATTARRLETVRDLVGLAQRADLMAAPAPRQAVQLLLRTSLLASTTWGHHPGREQTLHLPF
ncbi:DUF6895 family protein [Streptomyces sp. NPDC101165]|uniref:DUF6895 family protein n=1 Tax=Streptomyces sp. NPDC101165 TaxID=3366119 RepID=UPI003807FCD6